MSAALAQSESISVVLGVREVGKEEPSVGAMARVTERRQRIVSYKYPLLTGEPPAFTPEYLAESVLYLRPKVRLSVISDETDYPSLQAVDPPRLGRYYGSSRARSGDTDRFLPLGFASTVHVLETELVEIAAVPAGTPLNITVAYAPLSLSRWQWVTQMTAALSDPSSSLSGKEGEEARRMFLDVHPYAMYAMGLIAVLHFLLDFLAFKNDVAFWRGKQSFTGLSLRHVVAKAVIQVVVCVYLYDEGASKLVLVPAAVGVVVEWWKVTRAFAVSVRWWRGIIPLPRLAERGTSASSEYDTQAWRFVGSALTPALAGFAVYSLVAQQHTGIPAWLLKTAVGVAYGAGFIFMTPQLYMNYRLKTVAHLPWRVFMYKASSTFIDDVFAFFIAMPTMHRLSCLRDDFIFLILLYQRWLYPIDYTRANEFGQSFGEEEEEEGGEGKKEK
jgi:hypothetical protein